MKSEVWKSQMHSPTTGNLQPCTDTNMNAGAPIFNMSSHKCKADCGLVAPANQAPNVVSNGVKVHTF